MKKDKAVRKKELKAALIKKLKSLIGPMILLLIIVAGVLVIALYQEEEVPEEIVKVNAYEGDGEEIILENEELKLVMDSATTQFYLEVKDTGEIWKSNPDGAADDTKALKQEKEKLQSTMLLTYSTLNGVDTLYNNYKYSMANGIYEIEQGEDYIKIYYSIGDTERVYLLPPVTTEVQMDEWRAKMDAESSLMVQRYYKKYDINDLGKKDNKEELLANYPILETEVIYVLRDTTKDNVKSKLEEIFTGVGYDENNLKEDQALDLSIKVSDKPVFNVNVIYRLEGNDLVVEVPMDEMQYRDEYPLYYLSVLPYFGATGTEDEGFMLVPEGGGAIINFNNGKVAQSNYYANIYGWDMAQVRTALVHETRAYYSVFGMSKGDNSFLCILEDGAPYAAIQADVSGRNHSYNYVNAQYNITHREQYDVSDKYNGEMYVYEPVIPQEDLITRYRFVDSGDYVDMAKAYNEYLTEEYGADFTLNDDTDTPVNVEIVGAVDKVKQVVGIPVSRPLKLTSYEEAQAIINDLLDKGVENMSVKYTGWMNGGVKQKMLNKVKLISDLGSKKDLQGLIDYANANDITVYLDGITDYALDSGMWDGFMATFDAARLVSKEKAELYEYSTVMYGQRDDLDPYYLLKASVAKEMAENLLATTENYGAGTSFQNIGKDLSSDFTRKAPQSRQATLNVQEQLLKEASDAGKDIMINMGNDYAIAYADMVTNMDLSGSEYTIIDKTVPFYQLAIHGYVNYTGESLNLTQNFEDELLRSAEYGAGLSFTFTEETAFALQKTLYTQYFGADYASWQERMMEIYTRYNQELGHVYNQKMVDHEYVSDTVTCTTYEDGTKVYVNYGYEDYKAGAVNVAARDYKAVK